MNTKKSGKRKLENSRAVPFEVYCRFKPRSENSNSPVIERVSDTVILVRAESTKSNAEGTNIKETKCRFTKVFPENSSQKFIYDEIVNDMVYELFKGQNGMVFAFGPSGSGKSYTISGTPEDQGIIFHSLQTIFTSLQGFLLNPNIIVLNRNFTVESCVNYHKGRGLKIDSNDGKTPGSDQRYDNPLQSTPDSRYAVFISLTEFYNNNVYDLFDEIPENALRSKLVKENNSGIVYIDELVYIPVFSMDQAVKYYEKGIKSKKMRGNTSRHSLFSIYIARVPVKDGLLDISSSVINWISFCDMGCERSTGCKALHDRFKDSSSIKSSTIIFRMCIAALRHNHKIISCSKAETKRYVPYRESNVTYLLKNFAEGHGNLRLVLCLDQWMSDFDENLQFLKFAEILKNEKSEYLPEKNDFSKIKKLPSTPSVDVTSCTNEVFVNGIYALPPFPATEISSLDPNQALMRVISFLHERSRGKDALGVKIAQLFDDIETAWRLLEADNKRLEEEKSSSLRNSKQLQKILTDLEVEISGKKKTSKEIKERLKNTKVGLAEKSEALRVLKDTYQAVVSRKVELKRKLKAMQASENERFDSEIEKRVDEAVSSLERKLRIQDERLKLVKGVFTENDQLTH